MDFEDFPVERATLIFNGVYAREDRIQYRVYSGHVFNLDILPLVEDVFVVALIENNSSIPSVVFLVEDGEAFTHQEMLCDASAGFTIMVSYEPIDAANVLDGFRQIDPTRFVSIEDEKDRDLFLEMPSADDIQIEFTNSRKSEELRRISGYCMPLTFHITHKHTSRRLITPKHFIGVFVVFQNRTRR